jgi:hypothetical protein
MKNFLFIFVCFLIIKIIGAINPFATTAITGKKQIEVKEANFQTFTVVGTLTQQEAVRLNLSFISPLFNTFPVFIINEMEEYLVINLFKTVTKYAEKKQCCYGIYQATEVYSDS